MAGGSDPDRVWIIKLPYGTNEFMKPFCVGIDSYSTGPLRLTPVALLDWANKVGAEGVHFTDIYLPAGQELDEGYLRELGQRASTMGLYVEWGGGQHIPFDMTNWRPRDLAPINETAVRQAGFVGARVIRSCSGGLMRWSDVAPPTETLLRETARTLGEQMPWLADAGVVLAIELHFEFTTFEWLRIFEMCGAEPGGCLGICLDTMNLLTMLEDPLAATERILPWIVAVHAKDGGIRTTDAGLESFTAEIGNGVVDFERILDRLATLQRTVHLSVEDHGGSFSLPIHDPMFLSRFPDLSAGELARLQGLARESERRIAAGRLAPLERADWPKQCEGRLQRDIGNLKTIVAQRASRKAGGSQK